MEHYQKYQTIWNGENGRTIMFQNEMPYDPPTQEAWQHDNGGINHVVNDTGAAVNATKQVTNIVSYP